MSQSPRPQQQPPQPLPADAQLFEQAADLGHRTAQLRALGDVAVPLGDVAAVVGLHRYSITRLEQRGKFPKRIPQHRFSLQVRTQNRRRDVLAQVLQVALDELIDDGADVLPAKAGPPLKAELSAAEQTRRRA